MTLLFVLSFLLAISGITPSYLEDNILQYFNSAVINRAKTIWQMHMVAYENVISTAIKENYGFKGLNIYVRKPINPLHVGTGYYHTDNQVHLVLQDMNLDEFPHLSDPMVRFPLLSNVMKIEAIVSRMNVKANYIQFRNTSNIAYGLIDQNSYKMSPFLFEQVRSVGQLAITVEGCKVSGIGITSLIGRTVTLGNTVFRLLNCNFNFEIFSPGVGSPPVIADYLPSGEGLNLESLIMKPLQAELYPKMQALLQTYINTSSIFKETLGELRAFQSELFAKVSNYVNVVIKNLNVLTITNNMGKYFMEDFRIRWNDTFEEGAKDSVLRLHNMVLTGLETVYSSHTGGPFVLTTLKLSEELRYGSLQVRGSIDMQVGGITKGMYEFAVEINDVSVDVTANLESKANSPDVPARSIHVIQVMGWRSAQFSSPGMTFKTGEALIIGYLQTKVPIHLANHLNELLGQAVALTDKEDKNLDILTLGAAVPNDVLNDVPNEGNDLEQPNIYDENGNAENANGNYGDVNYAENGEYDDAGVNPEGYNYEYNQNIENNYNYNDGGDQNIGNNYNYNDGGDQNIGNNYNYNDGGDQNIGNNYNYNDGDNQNNYNYNYGDNQNNYNYGDNQYIGNDYNYNDGGYPDGPAYQGGNIYGDYGPAPPLGGDGNMAPAEVAMDDGGEVKEVLKYPNKENEAPSGSSDGQQLHAKLFDENMFAIAQNQNPDDNENNEAEQVQ